VNNGSGSSFASTVAGYIQDHKSQRADAITSIFMTNHDQDRASESFGRDAAKEKQAAAMLLTSEGKPFIYMGEELGYWGKTDKGDASRRQPMAWDKKLTGLCKFGLSDNHKSDITDYNMVKADISVETQEADENSLLNVYKTWSRLRNTYPALAEGAMSTTDLSGSSIASWYMTAGSQKLLVIHNVANTEKTVTVGDSMKKPVALLGTATTSAKDLTLGAHSSVVFEL
jgi:glycosidase